MIFRNTAEFVIDFLNYRAEFLNRFASFNDIIKLQIRKEKISMNLPLKFNYDYSECMVMKLGLAIPDKEHTNKSKVLMTFDEALDYIKKIDNITQGITKIYYLVGWQYLGHDD